MGDYMMFEVEMENAIDNCFLVVLTFDSKNKGKLTRKCVPFDIGPRRNALSVSKIYFHFYDLGSPNKQHNLSVEPVNILELRVTEEKFEPSNYVNWTPAWFYPRNWGNCS